MIERVFCHVVTSVPGISGCFNVSGTAEMLMG